MKLIDQKIIELQSPDGGSLKLSETQIQALRQAMADYAFSACIDSDIRNEAEEVLSAYEEE